jgi:rare lipoprotein A
MIHPSYMLMAATVLWMASTSFGMAQTEEGQASYYANKFKGRRTSSGEKYHPDSLTAAHRTYPFGSLLLVTNKQNGKQVVVKVNDRGPFTKGRVVDLSMKAALHIDMVRSGVVPVRVELAAEHGIMNSNTGLQANSPKPIALRKVSLWSFGFGPSVVREAAWEWVDVSEGPESKRKRRRR